MSHLETVCNGLGAPSVLLVAWAIQRKIPATVAITGDTGGEQDRLGSNGRRYTNREYFDEVIAPMCKGSHVEAVFVRSVDKDKNPMPSLREQLIAAAKTGKVTGVPVFGSKGGRMMQSCTDKMKIRAIRQESRRRGAKTGRNAQGIHKAEAWRRTKGIWIWKDNAGFDTYQTTVKVKGVEKPVKWQTHYYPLVDLGLNREDVYREVKGLGIPYLISSECDFCPHKDLDRWERTSEATLKDCAEIEALFGGSYFLTDRRVPLMQAIEEMKKARSTGDIKPQTEIDFGCVEALCGV